MNIYIISASQRSNSQSLRVANHLSQRLVALDSTVTATVLDLATAQLPLVDDNFLMGQNPAWTDIKAKVKDSDGFVFITPEWAGMATPTMLNFLLACNYDEAGHKPALLVGVSAARGGAYPISQLRSMGYKNNRILYLPEHLIIRNVEETMAELEKSHFDDAESYMAQRVDYNLQLLLLYTRSQKQLRQSSLVSQNPYENGM